MKDQIKEFEDFKAERSSLAIKSQKLEDEQARVEGEQAESEKERLRLEEQLQRHRTRLSELTEQKRVLSEDIERNNAKRPRVVEIAEFIQKCATRVKSPYDTSI